MLTIPSKIPFERLLERRKKEEINIKRKEEGRREKTEEIIRRRRDINNPICKSFMCLISIRHIFQTIKNMEYKDVPVALEERQCSGGSTNKPI